MGDSHFLLQNTLTGIVFLIFALISMWFTDEQTALLCLKIILATDNNQWQIILFLLSTPILGVIIQGIGMAGTYLKGHPYEGQARKEISERFRKAVQSIESMPKDLKHEFTTAPDDAIFSWYLYETAQPNLIEWYRRRLTFRHLAENWVTASLLGVAVGISIGSVTQSYSSHTKSVFLAVYIGLALVWIIGLLFLRARMNHDARALEIVWLYSNLYPSIKEKIKDVNPNEKEIKVKVSRAPKMSKAESE